MLAFGFFQEKLKIGINYIIEYSAQIADYDNLSPESRATQITEIKENQNIPYDYYYAHSSIPQLFNFTTSELNRLKWGLTFLFIAVHFLAVWICVKWWFGEAIPFIKLAIAYAVVIALAATVYLGGKLLGYPIQSYAFARELLGGIQSLVPLMLLAPAIWLQEFYRNTNTSTHES